MERKNVISLLTWLLIITQCLACIPDGEYCSANKCNCCSKCARENECKEKHDDLCVAADKATDIILTIIGVVVLIAAIVCLGICVIVCV